MLEARRHNKEMSAQRELADKAEASRFTELRNYLDTQRQQSTAADTQAHTALLARLEQLEKTLAQRAEQTENSLAAHVGELEDRLERKNLV